MRRIKVRSIKNRLWISEECDVAESFSDRLRGLIGQSHWDRRDGLLLSPCHSIHMWGMKHSIDVLFLRKTDHSSEFQVVLTAKDLKPWRLTPVGTWRAHCTLELPLGTLERTGVKEGDLIWCG